MPYETLPPEGAPQDLHEGIVEGEQEPPKSRRGEVQVYTSAEDASRAALAPLQKFTENLNRIDLPGKEGLLSELQTAEGEVTEKAAERYREIEAKIIAERDAELARQKQEEGETHQRREAVLRHVKDRFVGFMKGDEFMPGHQFELIELLQLQYSKHEPHKAFLKTGEPREKSFDEPTLKDSLSSEQLDELVKDVYDMFGGERSVDNTSDYKENAGSYWAAVRAPVFGGKGYYLEEVRIRGDKSAEATGEQPVEDPRHLPLRFIKIRLGNENWRIAPAIADDPDKVRQHWPSS